MMDTDGKPLFSTKAIGCLIVCTAECSLPTYALSRGFFFIAASDRLFQPKAYRNNDCALGCANCAVTPGRLMVQSL